MLRLRRYCKQNKKYFNKVHNVRNKELRRSNLVLVFDLVQYQDISTTRKLALRQLGLYYITNVYKGLGTYILIELDRSRYKRTYASRLLKKFYNRSSSNNRRVVIEVVVPYKALDRSKYQQFIDNNNRLLLLQHSPQVVILLLDITKNVQRFNYNAKYNLDSSEQGLFRLRLGRGILVPRLPSLVYQYLNCPAQYISALTLVVVVKKGRKKLLVSNQQFYIVLCPTISLVQL